MSKRNNEEYAKEKENKDNDKKSNQIDKYDCDKVSDIREEGSKTLDKNSKKMKKLDGDLPDKLDYFSIVNKILDDTKLNQNRNKLGAGLIATGIAFIFTIFNINDNIKLFIYLIGIIMIIWYIISEKNKRESGQIIEVDEKSDWHTFLMKDGVADSLLEYVDKNDNSVNRIIIFLLTTVGPAMFNFAIKTYDSDYIFILSDLIIIFSFLCFGIMKISNNENNILLKKLFEDYKMKSIYSKDTENNKLDDNKMDDKERNEL